MCGGYNLEACRLALQFREERRRADQEVRFIVKGRKGAGYFQRRGLEPLHQEGWRREGLSAGEVERLLSRLLSLYRSGEVDEVHAVYTEFYSPIHRRVRTVRVLPVELRGEAPEAGTTAESIEAWHYEPTFREIVDQLLTAYLRVELCDVLLESYASEQGARMITMEEATERAEKSLQEYRVQHNRLRREAITTDLLGVLFASKAIEGAGLTSGRPA
jgi:F-type H+-transporting ATPase subunit gamma